VNVVVWHDLECGTYSADLPLWDQLAAGGTVLDVGAGTGRVALHLAGNGCTVTALDRDPVLLAVLADRAERAGVRVRTIVADAADFDAGEGFDLVAVPMQTIQLLPERAGFFRCARRAVRRGGLVALAIAAELEPFEGSELPPPDVAESEGRRFVSQPTAVRAVPGGTRIERLRHVMSGGNQITEHDVIVLATVSADEIAAEGVAAGLEPEATRYIEPTFDHVGSEVVLLRG
jgi:SAM-dependent methyltransferase